MLVNLRYTGQPFVDIGIAVITVFAKKRFPEEVIEEDLRAVARYIEQNYVRPPLRSYLTMAFTQNAWFAQNAYNPDQRGLSTEEQEQRRLARREWARRHLYQWEEHELKGDDLCVLTGLPTTGAALSNVLSPGRAGRAQMPLLQGDEAINFFPNGQPGLPVSGLALLALQIFPLGCARCGLGLLTIVSDNERLMYRLTRDIFAQNQANILQAQAKNEQKLPASPRSLKTLLIEMLLRAEHQRSNAQEDQEPASLTAYNFNNGRTPGLAIYHLPLEIVEFLRIVETPEYHAAWQQLEQRGWQRSSSQKGKTTEERRYNTLYEDLFTLSHYEGMRRFVRTYFLRRPRKGIARSPDDPRSQYSLSQDLDVVHWSLFELFLQKVVHMDATRIEQIRTLGDKLATYTRRYGGKRFFHLFFTTQKPGHFRLLLIKTNLDLVKKGQDPLFDLDSYIELFEEGIELMRPDWRFTRDLLLIRMIDQLKDDLKRDPSYIPDVETGEDGNGALESDLVTSDPTESFPIS